MRFVLDPTSSSGVSLIKYPAVVVAGGGASSSSSGDVTGPASSVDNAIVRFDGATGKLIQDYTSGAPTISDTGVPTFQLGAVINESGADSDTRIESDTNANMLFVDASANRVGIGTDAPADVLHAIGNFRFSDADIATKSMRFRIDGGDIDVEAAGKSIFWSVWTVADYTGTQRNKMVMKSDSDSTEAIRNWEFKDAPFAASHHIINGTTGGGVVLNEDGHADADVRIEGDTDANLFFTDASTDRVGIGIAAPAEKLDVAGNIAVSGTVDGVDVAAHAASTTAHGATGANVGTTNTQTLTNKRVTPRTGTATSSATPTINTDNVDFYSLTAQAADITSMTTNLSGTPTEAQKLLIAITGTAARAITWGASFEAGAVALPTTTVTTQRLDVGFIWNTVSSKWRCMASGSA